MGRFGREAPVSEVDAQRALLDSLMGINRNQEGSDIVDCKDERLCRCYFYGVCPKEGFTNTKMACGTCHLIHSDEFKEQYLALPASSREAFMYDDEVEREFNLHIAEAEKVIRRARNRVEEDGGGGKSGPAGSSADSISAASLNPETNPEVLALRARIELLSAQAEEAGNEGDIDKAQELATEMEELQKEKQDTLTKLADARRAAAQKTGGVSIADVNKKLRVCDVCGSLLSIFDSDARLADHFLGKQHVTFQTMREVLEEIRERRKSRPAAGASSSARAGAGAGAAEFGYSRGGGGHYGPAGGDRDRRDRPRDASGGAAGHYGPAGGDRDGDPRARDRDPRARDGDPRARDRDPVRDRDPRDTRDTRDTRDKDKEKDRAREASRSAPVVPSRPVLTVGTYYDSLDRYVKSHPVTDAVREQYHGAPAATPAPAASSGGGPSVIPTEADIAAEVQRMQEAAAKAAKSSNSSRGQDRGRGGDRDRGRGRGRDGYSSSSRSRSSSPYSSDSCSSRSRSRSRSSSSYTSRSYSSSSSFSDSDSSGYLSGSDAGRGGGGGRAPHGSHRHGGSSSRSKPAPPSKSGGQSDADYARQHAEFMRAQEKLRQDRIAKGSSGGSSGSGSGSRGASSSAGAGAARGDGDRSSGSKRHRRGDRHRDKDRDRDRHRDRGKGSSRSGKKHRSSSRRH